MEAAGGIEPPPRAWLALALTSGLRRPVCPAKVLAAVYDPRVTSLSQMEPLISHHPCS